MGKKQQKSKAIAFTFRPFLATFPLFINGQKQQKSKAIALVEFHIDIDMWFAR